jgi:hypothetical protein
MSYFTYLTTKCETPSFKISVLAADHMLPLLGGKSGAVAGFKYRQLSRSLNGVS